MPRAAKPTAKVPAAARRDHQRLELTVSATSSGSSRISTWAKVLGLSKMDMTRPGMPSLTVVST